MIIKFRKMFPDAQVPLRRTPGAVGYDVAAYHVVDKHMRQRVAELPAVIAPGESLLIGIGVQFAVPFPVDCQVRPRSGLASKYDVELSNSPGTIDPDYRGEAGILLRNRGNNPFTVEKAMWIAQLVFTTVAIPTFVETEQLPPSLRDAGGFGSTGMFGSGIGETEASEAQRLWDEHFMKLAMMSAGRSNCLRGASRNAAGEYEQDAQGRYCGAVRRFGCIIVKDNNIVSSGYNMRTTDCDPVKGCAREYLGIPSGQQNDVGCLHAEQVAIQNHARTNGVALEGATVYVNAAPCLMCAKTLMRCGITAVVVPKGVYENHRMSFLSDAGIEIREIDMQGVTV